jgi:hypothetical protein
MAKIYVFGIGGTGSRVLKSLTMLLASGVECPLEIVPIIIDHDIQNGDYEKASNLIRKYVSINQNMGSPDCKFFKTKMSLVGQTVPNNGLLCLTWSRTNALFNDFIGYNTLDENNKALVDMLFSRETLEMDMSHGFQGNPNMGCVVQNQFEGNPIFTAFANQFQEGDRIFIISSIFGGTGSSGFPLLRKLLHQNRNNDNGNWTPIKNAPIGAISVLPYYNVAAADKGDNSTVNAQEWNDKAKAALSYYQTENDHLDALYYIADPNPTTYKHFKGGANQTDSAHIVEMASALSIIDFANRQNFDIQNDGERHATTYKEFGIKDNQNNFSMFYSKTRNTIEEPLSRFLLFAKYMGYNAINSNNDQNNAKITNITAAKASGRDNHYDAGIVQPYASQNGFDAAFRSNQLGALDDIMKEYVNWLIEMAAQKHCFSPFKLEISRADDFVGGNLWNGKIFSKNWDRVVKVLNNTHGHIDKGLTVQQKFLLLFSKVTTELLTQKMH